MKIKKTINYIYISDVVFRVFEDWFLIFLVIKIPKRIIFVQQITMKSITFFITMIISNYQY